jgi:hypothetical protein
MYYVLKPIEEPNVLEHTLAYQVVEISGDTPIRKLTAWWKDDKFGALAAAVRHKLIS